MRWNLLLIRGISFLLIGCVSKTPTPTTDEVIIIQRETSIFSGEEITQQDLDEVHAELGEEEKQEEPMLSTGTRADHYVIYTDSGYEPVSLQITLGESVSFKNVSTIPLQVASDPHPVHTDYPGFDSGTGLASGEIYVYTFEKSGTYSYHNHFKSLHRGIIRIEDPSLSGVKREKTLPGSIAIRDKLLELFEPDDSYGSIKRLFDTIKADPKLVNDCHDMSHDLGHRAYELYGFSRALTFDDPNVTPLNDIDELCAGGYMHGVLEEVFLHDKSMQSNPERACANVPEEHQGSCYHGVGHGVMFSYYRDIEQAAAACRAIEAFEPEHRCYEGVYMELFRGNADHANGFLGRDVEDPLKICADAPYDEQAACYLYSHLGYIRTHKHDYQGAIDLCTNSPSIGERGKEFCIKGVGVTTMKSFAKAGLHHTENYTKSLSDIEKVYYYKGMVGYALLSGMTNAQIRQACTAMSRDSAVCLLVLENQDKISVPGPI